MIVSAVNNVSMDNLDIDVTAFRELLIAWGREHFRPFPWRSTSDPYRILIAEVMLHRTQALQVVPVYIKFINRYPSLLSLVQATKQELRELLYSIGLFWRIDLIYAMIVQLISKYNGIIPQQKEDLMSLPGVSDYIASAVRCFSWNLPDFIADTNTVRVVSRLLGREVKDSSRRSTYFRNVLAMLLDPFEPRDYNYSLLDLADQICTKKRPPECAKCPVGVWCLFKKRSLI